MMVLLWLETEMPTTRTLKNIPDDLYKRLEVSAQAHGRSLNSESIACLKSVLMPGRVMPGERLARARELRSGMPLGRFRGRDVDSLKRT